MALGLCASKRFPLREITNIIGMPKSTVSDVNKRDTGKSKPRSGRPRKVSARDMRQIVRYLQKNRTTRRITLLRLKRLFNLQVHENTLRSALADAGYLHKIAKRRPYLTNLDRKRRLKFAKEHKDDDWSKVIFTDEMPVKLFIERRIRDYVWRKAGEELHPDCITYQRHLQGTGMMFWGAFRKGKIGPGIFFDLKKGETVNSVTYRDQVLLGPLRQFWEESFEDISVPIIMEDNAPIHKKVCIPVRKEFGMTSLDWPPNSPDLNPIEHVWSYIKDIIGRDYSDVTSVKEMKRIVLMIWEEFQDNQWDGLIDSMHERMEAVIAALGGSTRF